MRPGDSPPGEALDHVERSSQIKVLHVIDSLGVGGGAEHSLAAILPLLEHRGVDSSITVLTERVGGLQQSLSDRGYSVTLVGGRSVLARSRALRRLIDSESPDLVHATLFHSCLVSRLALRDRRVPLLNSRVSTSYHPARTIDDATRPWKLHAIRRIDTLTANRYVDHFHVVTEEVRAETIEVLGIAPERITLIPRGRSPEQLGTYTPARRAAARQNLGLGVDVPVVLNVGRQDHAKDHVTLVRAFSKVLDVHPDAVLLLAGRPGDGTEALTAALGQLDIGPSVRLLGHRDDIAELYVAADVMAFPSLYEGAAGAVLEAMALGLPVVGSEAVAEVLRHGELGPVVPRGDARALATEVSSLLADPERRSALAVAANHEFTVRYQLTSVADRTTKMYRSVTERSEGSSNS